MQANRRRPHSAAVPGGAGSRAAGYYLFEDTYLPPHPQDALRPPPKRSPSAAGQRATRGGHAGQRPPLLLPATPPVGSGAVGARRHRQQQPQRSSKAVNGVRGSRGAGSPSPQPRNAQPPSQAPADAVAYRFFSERRYSNSNLHDMAHAASPTGGGLVRPGGARSPASAEPSQGAAARKATNSPFQPDRCVKYPSRPASSVITPRDEAKVAAHTYTSDSSDSDAAAVPRSSNSSSADERNQVGPEDDDNAGEDALLAMEFLSDARARELCHDMAVLLSSLSQAEAQRVVEAVQQEAAAQRALSRYGGVYGVRPRSVGADGACTRGGRAELLATLHGRWVDTLAQREATAAFEREARRRVWLGADRGPPAGSGAAAAAKRRAAGAAATAAATRDRKLLARKVSPSSRRTPAAPQTTAVVVAESPSPWLLPSAPAVSSPSMPRPPARKGRYSAGEDSGFIDSADDAWLRRQPESGDGSDARGTGGAHTPFVTRQPPHSDRASAETTAAAAESPDRSAIAGPPRKVPAMARLDEASVSHPSSGVFRAGAEGAVLPLSPGAAAARAAYMAAHPGEPYTIPAHVVAPPGGVVERPSGPRLGMPIPSGPPPDRVDDLDDVQHGAATPKGGATAFAGAAEGSGMRFDHGGYPDPDAADPSAAPSQQEVGSGAGFAPPPLPMHAATSQQPPGIEFSARPSARSGSVVDSVLKSTLLGSSRADKSSSARQQQELRHSPDDENNLEDTDTAALTEEASAAAPASAWDFATSNPPPAPFVDTQKPREQMRDDQLRFHTSGLPTDSAEDEDEETGEASAAAEDAEEVPRATPEGGDDHDGSAEPVVAEVSVTEHHTDQVDSLVFDDEADLTHEQGAEEGGTDVGDGGDADVGVDADAHTDSHAEDAAAADVDIAAEESEGGGDADADAHNETEIESDLEVGEAARDEHADDGVGSDDPSPAVLPRNDDEHDDTDDDDTGHDNAVGLNLNTDDNNDPREEGDGDNEFGAEAAVDDDFFEEEPVEEIEEEIEVDGEAAADGGAEQDHPQAPGEDDLKLPWDD